jgi:heme-degrading monooxygenase HmoA
MVTEIAQYTAQPGKADQLMDALRTAAGVIRRAEGCQSVTMRRCIEEPNQFIAQIQWETLEHHTVTFRGGPLFPEYRSHLTGLYVEPIVVHHYEDIAG